MTEPGPIITPDPQSAGEPNTAPADAAAAPPAAEKSTAGAAGIVAGAILFSRVLGLFRDVLQARYLGTSLYSDALRGGMRMPNVLQNLLGEGTLSASFIPIYSELLHEGRREEAGRFAGAVFALLLAVAGALSLLGVVLAPIMTDVFLRGFEGEQRELTIVITRIIFPMTGILVLSAWALGVLNSHRRFFIPYFAPVLWNAALIATFFLFGAGGDQRKLVVALAWGALIGGVLQFGIQLPWVLRLEPQLLVRWNLKAHGVREAIRNAAPAIMGRGVVQLSSYVDMFLASYLVIGAVSTYSYASTLYVLPVSLFGMSVAAAELPELSRRRGGSLDVLRDRASAGMERIAFYVVPSAVVFLALGDTLIAAVYQRGEFGRDQTIWAYYTLAGFSLGLVASTWSRLMASTFAAVRDTRTPARYATVRVVLSAIIGVVLIIQFEGLTKGGFDIPAGALSHLSAGGHPLGVVGLSMAAGIAAWVEWGLLRRALRQRIGAVGVRASFIARVGGAAVLAAGAGWAVRSALEGVSTLIEGVLVLGTFAVVYLGVCALLKVGEVHAVLARLGRLVRRR